MRDYQPAKLLRLHFTEADRYPLQSPGRDRPLYEAVVQRCLELGMAGATVLRGLEGFGDTAEIHRSHVLGHDLPVVVQIVDTGEKIQRLLPVVEEMMDKGLIAVSDVAIKRIETGDGAGSAGG